MHKGKNFVHDMISGVKMLDPLHAQRKELCAWHTAVYQDLKVAAMNL
jgi:hypothetical protein